MNKLTVPALLILFVLLSIYSSVRTLPAIERDLLQRTGERLAQADLDWVEVGARGWELTLQGDAPSKGQMALAEETVRDTWGVFRVDNRIRVEAMSEFRTVIRRENGKIFLEGSATSEDLRAFVVSILGRRYPGEQLEGNLRVDATGPGSWAVTIRTALQFLGRVDLVRLSLKGFDLDVVGRFASETQRGEFESFLRSELPPIIDVNVELDMGDMLTVQECQAELDMVLSERSVDFEPGTFQMTEASFQLLEEVVEAIDRCPLAAVRISAHTDSRGNADRNLELSGRRAAAVVTYLIQVGRIPLARLSAAGYGESKPIATNATAQGRSQNQRIEFLVQEN